MKQKIKLFRWLTLLCYFGLTFFLYIWLVWLQPPESQFVALSLLFFIGPLMLPLKGLLQGRAYTHAWASYVSMLYFVIGIWYAGTADTRTAGIVIALLSVGFFIGTIFYARYRGQQNASKNPD